MGHSSRFGVKEAWRALWVRRRRPVKRRISRGAELEVTPTMLGVRGGPAPQGTTRRPHHQHANTNNCRV
jgi:hypothetical protein